MTRLPDGAPRRFFAAAEIAASQRGAEAEQKQAETRPSNGRDDYMTRSDKTLDWRTRQASRTSLTHLYKMFGFQHQLQFGQFLK